MTESFPLVCMDPEQQFLTNSIQHLRLLIYGFSPVCVKTLIYMYTLKCLSIGTPKTINFPFVPNGKLTVFKCPKI